MQAVVITLDIALVYGISNRLTEICKGHNPFPMHYVAE